MLKKQRTKKSKNNHTTLVPINEQDNLLNKHLKKFPEIMIKYNQRTIKNKT